MAIPIKEHTLRLGIKGKTLSRLKAINIETLEDLAGSSIDTVRDRLSCTKERAMVLINKANRALHHLSAHGQDKHQALESSADD